MCQKMSKIITCNVILAIIQGDKFFAYWFESGDLTFGCWNKVQVVQFYLIFYKYV